MSNYADLIATADDTQPETVFDGTSLVELLSQSALGAGPDYTVFLEVTPNDTSTRQCLWEVGGLSQGLCIEIDGGAIYATAVRTGQSSHASAPIAQGVRQNVVVVWLADAIQLYINGNLDAELTPMPFGYASPGGNAGALGGANEIQGYGNFQYGVADTAFFDGTVHRYFAWGSALSEANIATLVAGEIKGNEYVTSNGEIVTSGGRPVTAGTAYPEVAAKLGLHLPCDDNAADTVVSNLAGTDAVLEGGNNTSDITTAGPRTGTTALQFSNDGRIQTTYNADGADLTFGGWFKPTHGGSGGVRNARFIDMNEARGFTFRRVERTLQYYFVMGSPATGSGVAPTLTQNVWQHFVGRYDSVAGEASIFIDGAQVSGSPVVKSIPAATGGDHVRVCDGNNEGSAQNQACVYDVFVAPSALTDAEIAAHMVGQQPTNTTPATLTQSGSNLVINRGVWDAHNNGTLAGYFANIYLDGAFVEQITLPTQATSYSPSQDGSYVAEVNVSNDAGWADSERSVTSPAIVFAGSLQNSNGLVGPLGVPALHAPLALSMHE